MNTILERRKKMESYNRLLEHNIKPSMQRIAIMNYLMERLIFWIMLKNQAAGQCI